MKIEKAELLMLMARFLEYPDEDFIRGLADFETEVQEHLSSRKLAKEFVKRCQPLMALDWKDLQELYVDTFDYKEKTGLYLTAQELGDSRRRGMALIQLQKLIEDLGFERVSDELADYIPMLLELLAVADEGEQTKLLERRLSYALHRIVGHLSRDNPYHALLEMLTLYVFEAPSREEIKLVESAWEDADLDPLPYPMFYQ
ncbi:nitrate reductase molybdenum cofactor assembly chaperone [Robertmurraya andreesenii]|uniref:Nitrate reductase delta subunit n=1 Tax=Anoxybacillus andreesenii TaxID=1325932 RepID=A0ABT9V947_9BACL|nr:nitrate reductase molybdenum cofactor assembly chaperone [Robertmurraya andreesenii]MDQ0157442.1 nitrate reductase delta subunit [Robertmurraya andreesenii]